MTPSVSNSTEFIDSLVCCVVLLIAEDEVFQIKKPSHSKRIVKQLKKESLRDKDGSAAASVKFEVSFGTEQVCACHVPKGSVLDNLENFVI